MRYTAVFLLCLVAFSFQATSPADAILERIDALVQSSRNEQAQQTRIYISQHARCQVEIDFRTKEINDAKVAMGASDQQNQICKAEIPIAVSALKQSKSELKMTNQQLRQIEIEHKNYVVINLARQKDHEEAIAAIQGAYNIIGNFANGKSALSGAAVFIQITQKMNHIFKLAVKHQFHQELVPVLTSLVALTSSPATTISTSELIKVVNLLRQLEAAVKKSDANRAAEAQKFEATFNLKQGLLTQQVNALNIIIKKYGVYIQSLNSCIRTETNIYNLANSKFATQAMCQAFNDKYQVQTSQRSEYVALLSKLRAFIVSAVTEFKSGLYNRENFVDSFAQIKKN